MNHHCNFLYNIKSVFAFSKSAAEKLFIMITIVDLFVLIWKVDGSRK